MATFIWTPTYGSNVTVKPTVEVAQYGDGYEQRVGLAINSKARKWALTFANRPNATADAIELFLGTANAIASFVWQPPQGLAGTWVCREWQVQQTGPYTRTITGTFDEVFE